MWADYAGVGHFEPNGETSVWDDYPVSFLDCHLRGSAAGCDRIYGSGRGSLCDGFRGECVADRGAAEPARGNATAPHAA